MQTSWRICQTTLTMTEAWKPSGWCFLRGTRHCSFNRFLPREADRQGEQKAA